jgi:hypothetical protein
MLYYFWIPDPKNLQKEAFENYMKNGGAWLGFTLRHLLWTNLPILKTGIGIIINFWSRTMKEGLGDPLRPF